MGMWFLEMMHADSMRSAAALLARRGYDNVQAAALAGALRMSVGSLYRHYGSKPGLALAVRDFTERELSYQADVAFRLSHGKPGVDFARAFATFWWELAGWALRNPDLFGFTFLHWHAQEYGPHSPPAPGLRVAGALVPQQSSGGATRALVRQVLEEGEREGALIPGCVQWGEGLVWGALVDLVRMAGQGAQVGEAEVNASVRALWRALG
ncbi:TetR/AcrR family transcriptional regulator, partial [Pyxidicoccus sp. 3LFB2]